MSAIRFSRLAVVFFVLLCPSTRLLAVARSWNNSLGGVASIAANWTPGGSPTAADDLTFGLNSTYFVVWGVNAPASNSQTYSNGSVTLNVSSPHAIGSALSIAPGFGQTATAALDTGEMSVAGPLSIGGGLSSHGMLTVDGLSTQLSLSTMAGDLTIGGTGEGTLNVLDAGHVVVADRFVAGSGPMSSATINVSGFNLLAFASSTLTVSGSSQPHAIGAGGNASMIVSNRGHVEFAGDVNLAQGSASTSTLTIDDAGPSSSVTIAGDFSIGANQTAGAAAGNGSVDVKNLSTLDVGGALNVGNDPDGGIGSLHIADSGVVEAGSFLVGPGGTLQMDGGTLDIFGGQFAYHGSDGAFELGAPGHPTVTLRDGATGTLDQTAFMRVLTLGGGTTNVPDSANLDVRSGSTLNVGPGLVVIGPDIGDDGQVIVNGAGSSLFLDTGSTTIVGANGTGWLEAELGGHIEGGHLIVGQSINGYLMLEGVSTTAVFNDIVVGGTGSASGGIGDMEIVTGAHCDVTDTGTGILLWDDAALQVLGPGSALSCAGGIESTGLIVLDEGVINASIVRLVNSSMEANGLVNSDLFIASNAAALTLTGDLTVGRTTSSDGLTNSGFIDVGSHTLTIKDMNTALLNTCDIGPGGRVVAFGGVTISGSDIMTGDGATIEANVTNQGMIVSHGAGVTFKGAVFGVGQGISGTRIAFIDGGRFIGAGVIDAPVFGDAAAIINPIDDLTMGASTNSNGYDVEGELTVQGHTVQLLDANVVELGDLTSIAGGVLDCPNGIHLDADDTLVGFGTVHGRLACAPGSGIHLAGDLSLLSGDVGVENLGGLVDVGSHTLTLGNDDHTRISGELLMNGGVAQFGANSPAECQLDGVLSGSGAIVASVLTPELNGIGGTISPGGAVVGAMGVSGDIESGPHTLYRFDVSGPGSNDHLMVGGAIELAGNLDVHFIGGYVPNAQASYSLISAAAVHGDFAGVSIPGVAADLHSVIDVTDTDVTLRILRPGDLNCDEAVSADDVERFVQALLHGDAGSPCSFLNADVNRDGMVNGEDIQPFMDLLLE
ncbi:MAG: hypothetical protein H6818_17555 [Phycisphaerales bacterium]|nr:hypothetical protein [Phycisphaerales bacterium]